MTGTNATNLVRAYLNIMEREIYSLKPCKWKTDEEYFKDTNTI